MRKITIAILLLFIILNNSFAQDWTQISSDIDGEAAGDYSGTSVSLSNDGSIVAIGANYNDGNGNICGHVRIFKNQSGTWTQIGTDIDGESVGDASGSSVCLNDDGSVVAIGAFGNNIETGHARIYENQSGNWVQIGDDIDGEAGQDRFGHSVSLNADGSVVAIGAIYNDVNGNCSGHVRVFENQNDEWVQIGNDINGESEEDFFGSSVSLSADGSILAIGATHNDGNGSNAGRVQVYENQSGAWIQIGNDIDGETAGDYSGCSVDLSSDGSIVAIGANYNDGNGENAGHVRIFENQSGTWNQIGSDIDGEAIQDRFGCSVKLSTDGSVVVIGAYANNYYKGHVRIYENQNSSWHKIGSDINGEAANDNCGWSVSLNSDGSIVAIGAPYNDGNGDNAGHVRVYEYSESTGNYLLRNEEIKIFPNPTKGLITLDLGNKKAEEVRITNVDGKTVALTENISETREIDISHLCNGIYWISITIEGEVHTSKIIKN
ncbi:MAG: T9SS type A sorting domain-containing protein [Bacteroidales bacterium]|nr:T9SS type A sorting domain-containing protein [Bacteroidales bacterium]